MPASLTTVANLLKVVYEGGLQKQLNDETVALKRIVKTSDGVKQDVSGKYVEFPLHYKRNNGIGARREWEDLPAAGNQGTTSARVGLKYLYGAMSLSGQTLELTDTDKQAFISTLELEMDGLKRDLAKDLNRQVYGNATGAVGTTSSTTSITNPVITSGIQQFQEGMLVDVYTAANLAADSTPKATGLEVLAIGTNTITLSAAVLYTAGDVFVRKGNANREWTGLGAMINDSGTLFNVDPTVFSVWKSTVDANAGTPRPIAESLLIKNIHAVRQKGGKTSLLMTTLGVQRSYFNLLQSQRQYVGTKDFVGGFSGLGIVTDQGELPLVSDPDGIPGTIYGLDEKDLTVYRSHDWKWLDRDGSMWKQVAGKDGWIAYLSQYSELGMHRRNSHFVIRDITES